MKIYEAVAQAFRAEGVQTHFSLLGDGNLHWAIALQEQGGVRAVHARHEHCAAAMALGYASATGDVGVASVTCGPGFTQLMTALASGARDRLPLVVFAGESPMHSRWWIQEIDQRPLAVACGAAYIAAHSAQLIHYHVQEAFRIARHERRPVVLGVPYDFQQQEMPDIGPYEPSSRVIPELTPILPDPAQIRRVAERLRAAKRPLLVGGRGLLAAQGESEVERLADLAGALLATSLPARGLFDHHPFSLGVVGGYGRMVARECGGQADLVLAFGASLSAFTRAGGMFANAEIVQVDAAPVGRRDGNRVADLYLRADARLAAAALLDELGNGGALASEVRTPELARRIREEPADDGVFPDQPNTVDPREAFKALERSIPGDYDVIGGSGHQAYFHTVMRGGDPRRYHSLREFGAIGNALSYAIGVAAARGNDGKVVVYDGDGGLLMNIQELETIARHGFKVLIVACNDGAFGAETHHLRKEGLDDSIVVFGRPDLSAIARGFGLTGETVTDAAQLAKLSVEYEAGDRAALWDIHVNDRVMNPSYRLGNKHAKQD